MRKTTGGSSRGRGKGKTVRVLAGVLAGLMVFSPGLLQGAGDRQNRLFLEGPAHDVHAHRESVAIPACRYDRGGQAVKAWPYGGPNRRQAMPFRAAKLDFRPGAVAEGGVEVGGDEGGGGGGARGDGPRIPVPCGPGKGP